MKKLLHVLVLLLAVHFLAVAGAVGWLFQSGKLDRDKATAIRDMVFPATAPAEVVTTQPATQPAAEPSGGVKLDELLAKYAGRRAGEQVELIQQSIDGQAATLDRRARELDNLMGQILREKEELALKSGALDAERQRLVQQQKQQAAQAGDKGFQDSLNLYTAMPGKQAKSAFMAMPDELVARYLQAMPPRTATRIIKEFKSAEEQERVNRVLERVRQGGGSPAAKPGEPGAVTQASPPPPTASNTAAALPPRE